jgi:hypothetical protein
LGKLAHAVSWWLGSAAKTFNGNEDLFFNLIRRILALYRDVSFSSTGDPVFEAINHPVGHVTEAALRWWYRQTLEDNQGLTVRVAPIFSDLCDTAVATYRYGRTILAAHVIALFRVDRKWAAQHLLPRFDWRASLDEAGAAWEGFLWSPRLYWPLIEAIKPHFLATAEHFDCLGKHAEQYAALLTFAALEPTDIISRRELAEATRSLPARGLQRAARALADALSAAGDQRHEFWLNRIVPYLRFVWPKSREVVTDGISENLALLCIAAQDSFPDALNELKPWLQPLSGRDFVGSQLYESGLCHRFPEEALAFLDAVIDRRATWPPFHLHDCLRSIVKARPGLKSDDRFRRISDAFPES